MPLAQLTNLHYSLGERTLFDRLCFTIDRGERVGLIGDNGAGKTTLFRMLSGALRPDTGEVSIAKSAKLGLLEQDPVFTPGHSVLDEAELAFVELHDLAHQMRDLEHAMATDHSEKILNKYQDLQHRYEDAGGYAWHHRLEATLDGVGLARSDWEKPVEALSGGQRSRLALAKLLVAEPDLLLLDEPTNHLDIAATEWLENYLLGFSGAVLLISHDRYLLDRVATRIVWLTRQQLSSYPGNFTAFQNQREVEVLTLQRTFEQQRAHIEKQQEYIRRFQAGQRARQAAGRKKVLTRFLQSDQVVQVDGKSRGMNLKLSTDQRAGDQLLRVRELSKKFDGRLIWDDVQFDLKRGDRVGIIGPNGSGKTTLLRTLVGQLDADGGDVRWGANLTIGYYDQRLDDFDPDLSIYEEVLSDVTGYNDQQIRDALGAMLFSGDDTDKPMKLLSGGERARVALCKLLMQKPNVLLLDEPTNHLDVNACEALEASLRNFDGSILCVSHDRYFLDRMTSRLLILEPPGIRDFLGGYAAWTAKQADERQQRAAPRAKPASPPPPRSEDEPPSKPVRKENPYKRKFGSLTVAQLESEIAAAESSIARLHDKLLAPATYKDANLARATQHDLNATQQRHRELEEEYYQRG